MAYKLIAADLDHTLLRSDGTISPFTRDVIGRCMDAGIGFTFATGRMYRSALPIARQLDLQLPLITYQGALLKDVRGNVMHALHLPQEMANILEQILRGSGLHYTIYADENMYFSSFEPQFLEYARHIKVQPLAAPKELGHIAVTQFGVFADPDDVESLRQQIFRQFGNELHLMVTNGRFLEICHPMARKDYGLAQLAEHLEIRPEDVVAVGDNSNDLSMLRYAGLGVAVENAVPAAKLVADRLTASNDEDGVAKLIEELIL